MSSTPTQPGADFDGPGLIANRYQIKQRLGKGTYGEVFLADDLKFNPPRSVAIKILHDKFLNEAEVRADIAREASVLARFNHPNILRVIDFDISETQAFIVTELAEGGSLARKIRPDPMKPPVRTPLDEVGWYLEQLTDALDEAHQAGLIHRDLKPLNILLNRRGRPLIADFGLATAVSSSQSSMLVDTQTSGTPPYMAPEQWMGHAGRASDIYAMGIITFQLITSELPFQGSQFELFGQHMNAPIPRLGEKAPGLAYPPALDSVIQGVLAKDPKMRTRSALDFYRNYRQALMPFQSPSGSVDSFQFQPGQQPTGSLGFQSQPFQPTQSGSNPPGSNTPNGGPLSNQPGSNPTQQPQGNAYQTGPFSGATPPGSNPPTAPIPTGGYNPNFQPPTAAANRPPMSGSFSGLTTGALPPNNFTPENNRPGVIGQPGANEPNFYPVEKTQVLGTPSGPVRKSSKINPGLIAGVAAVVAVILIAAIIGVIMLLNSGTKPTGPTQVAAITPTVSAGADTTSAPDATTATDATTAPPTTVPPGSGQALIARQGSLRKVAVSDGFVKTAIQGVSSSASSNTTLQVFSSSESPNAVKTELDNGLVGDGYTYAVPETHANPPSDFYGGYTKDGAPDIVYVILDTASVAAVLKSNGADDATIAKIVSDTKGQQSVIFSYEGDGFNTLAFPPPSATTAAPTTAAATTGSAATPAVTGQTSQSDLPVYNGATVYTLPEGISSQVESTLGSSSLNNMRFTAYEVVGQDNEIKRFFDAYLAQNGWTDTSSQLPADAAQVFKDGNLSTSGPYTKGSDVVFIIIGKGIYASEFTGVADNVNVYMIVRGNT